MCALQRCLCYRDKKYRYSSLIGLQRDRLKCAHCRDVYDIEISNTGSSLIRAPKGQYQVCAYRDVYVIVIRNTVRSLIQTPKGQYRVCALQRCLCYSDRKCSSLFNTDSKRTVSSVRFAEMSIL